MSKVLRLVMACVALAMLCQPGAIAGAQQSRSAAPPAPIPAQILAAKRVFVSTGGGEELDPRTFLRSLDSNRPYDEFYAAIKAGGRFEPVLSPADADLILDFRFRTFDGHTWPQFRLVIIDPKTHTLLWAFIETVKDQSGPHRDDKS